MCETTTTKRFCGRVLALMMLKFEIGSRLRPPDANNCCSYLQCAVARQRSLWALICNVCGGGAKWSGYHNFVFNTFIALLLRNWRRHSYCPTQTDRRRSEIWPPKFQRNRLTHPEFHRSRLIFLLRYGDLTIFKMAAVRHLEFKNFEFRPISRELYCRSIQLL